MMVQSSEELIKRRQITNGFFTTIIGALVAMSGLLMREDFIQQGNSWVLIVPAVVAVLLCRSWKNLVENYGKLNKGKFRVIHRLEKELPARVFEAEWNALGKGLRPKKYRSFTDTEQIVPKLFMLLLVLVIVVLLGQLFWAWWDGWQPRQFFV